LGDEKRQTQKEDIMDVGQVTVNEILEKRLGEEKSARVLKEINDAYQKGKRGDDLREQFKDAIKKEGLDSGEVKVFWSHVIPTS
jgi:hypothetical protein